MSLLAIDFEIREKIKNSEENPYFREMPKENPHRLNFTEEIRKDADGNKIERYSFICKGCKDDIAKGEKVHLCHLRHGKKIGEVSGYYDGFGGINEDKNFNSLIKDENNLNNYYEIQKSLFNFEDSSLVPNHLRKYKILTNPETYEEIPISILEYARLNDVAEKLIGQGFNPYQEEGEVWDFLCKIKKEYDELPDNLNIIRRYTSGICAYHELCFQEKLKENKKDWAVYKLSKLASSRGMDEPRKIFT